MHAETHKALPFDPSEPEGESIHHPMWTKHEHHGGEYTGPAGALVRPVYRGPATGDRRRTSRADLLRWPHDGGADDILAFEVWSSDRDTRAAGKAPASGWFGIRCLTGKEAEAREELEALGVEVVPLTYRTRTWPRKKRRSVIVERPLCPSYVFAFIQPGQWPQLRACNRVIGWIADDKGPLPVASEDQLRKLQNAASAGAFDDTGVEAVGISAQIAEPMAFWTNLLNSIFETGKPIRAVDGRVLRDNPIAIAEGAPGAPGLQHRALAIVVAGDVTKLQRLPVVAGDNTFADVLDGVFLNSGTLRARGTFWVGSQYESARARFVRRRSGIETIVADLAGINNAGIVLTADIPFQPLDRITMRVGRIGTGVAVQASNATFSTSGGDFWLLEKTDAAEVVNSSRGS